MKKLILSAAVAGLLGAGVAAPAAAYTHHPAALPYKPFKLTVTPLKPKVGQAVTASGTSTEKHASFHCVELLIQKGHTPGSSNAWLPTLRTPSSNAKGKVVCKDTFAKFSLTLKGKKHHCPPSKADKASGWGCGMVIASNDQKSIGIKKFKF
jgi:hypothetical protein